MQMEQIKYLVWAGTCFPVFLIPVIILFVFHSFNQFEENKKWVYHTNQVIISATSIQKQMIDLETGLRGFLITGKPNFLEPYEAAKSNIFSDIEQLKSTVSDNPPQVARLENLTRKIQKWLNTVGLRGIEVREDFNKNRTEFHKVSDLVASEFGKNQVDHVRDLLKEFIAIEEGLERNRSETLSNSIASTKKMLIMTACIVLMVILITGFYSARIVLSENWIKSKLSVVLGKIQKFVLLDEFANNLLKSLTLETAAEAAVFYCLYEDGTPRVYSLGCPKKVDDTLSQTNGGEGLLARCFSSGEEIHLKTEGLSDISIQSYFGNIAPKELFLIPIKQDEKVIGVLELVAVSEFREKELNLIREVSNYLGVLIRNIYSHLTTERLINEIKDSEKRSSGIINSSLDSIVTFDGSGLIESVNLASRRLFGYSVNEMLGQDISKLIPDIHESSTLKEIKAASEGVHKTLELEGEKKNGQRFSIEISLSKVNMLAGSFYSIIIRDITLRKKSESEMKQTNSELEEFTYRMSHDLRAPVVSASKLLEITKQSFQEGDQEDLDRNLTYAHSSLQKLDVLISDILALFETKERVEENERVELIVLFRDAVEKLSYLENFSSLDFIYDFKACETVVTKKSRIALIVENLVSNAIKYQDKNKEYRFVKASCYTSGNFFFLEVKDNGLGIPEGKRDQVFNMFNRFHASVSFGSGLGLYLMKKSAEYLDGQVFYEPLESGSVFRLKLPVLEVVHDDTRSFECR